MREMALEELGRKNALEVVVVVSVGVPVGVPVGQAADR